MKVIFSVKLKPPYAEGVCNFTFSDATSSNVTLTSAEYEGVYERPNNVPNTWWNFLFNSYQSYKSHIKVEFFGQKKNDFKITSVTLTDEQGVVHPLIIPQDYKKQFNCEHSNDQVSGEYSYLFMPISPAFISLIESPYKDHITHENWTRAHLCDHGATFHGTEDELQRLGEVEGITYKVVA